MVDPNRIHYLRKGEGIPGPVIYWMQRDQRAADNWALLHAADIAKREGRKMAVVFALATRFLEASPEHFCFMIHGLKETREALAKHNIPFFVLEGEAPVSIPRFVRENHAGHLVTDFNPLKPVLEWKERLSREINIPFTEVDAHNVLPCRVISPKAEFGAMHLRRKIQRRLMEFLVEFPTLPCFSPANMQHGWLSDNYPESGEPRHFPPYGLTPGPQAAERVLDEFISNRLGAYPEERNDPTKPGQSGLSPYLHFGQLAPLRVALNILNAPGKADGRVAFLEELIVRRELADNFCHYNKYYDSVEGFHRWARTTLDQHRGDQREYLYSPEQFSNAETHDPLWNAAQRELSRKGKMHGYMRMYWAKKILEWSGSPEEAMAIAIHLNDSLSLDGRDPNGYAGIAWSIGGVHDRAWQERAVFGKIRYMNFQGCKRKFDVQRYILLNRE